MRFTLDIKPLSVNEAYKGRRFNTTKKKQYDKTLALLLPNQPLEGPYYRVSYYFHLKNFALIDQQNLLKCLTDGIVRRGIIRDDRYIVEEHLFKFKADHDSVEIDIENVESGLVYGGR